MIAKKLVRLCYYLDDSLRYRQTKAFFRDLLFDPQCRLRGYFDLGMTAVVISSVSLLIYEVDHDLGTFGDLFEAFVVTLFVTEYLLRLWVYSDTCRIIIEHYERAEFLNTRFRLGPAVREALKKKWDYVTTPLAIIDLLAILPSFRGVRLLRVFLLFRLFKLFRYANSVNEFAKVLSEKRFELATLSIVAGFVVVASSTAIYVFESDSPDTEIHNIVDALYWSIVTVSTVGYGDIVPHTPEGRFIAIVLIVSGLGVISFFTSIVVSAFAVKLRTLREDRVLAEMRRISNLTVICGYGRVGEVVVEKLAADKERLLIIDKDPDKVDQARAAGHLVLEGDASSNDLLERLRIQDHVKTIVCTTGDDVVNVFITLTARYLSKGLPIVARANKRETVRKLELAGANRIVTPFDVVGRVVTAYVNQPVAFDALYGILSGNQDVGIEAVVVSESSLADGKTIEEINFPHYRLVLFGIVTPHEHEEAPRSSTFDMGRRTFYFHPPGDFLVQRNDILIVFGDAYSLNHFKDKLGKSAL